jgi:8-oxo-dGTP diphosphatase
VIEGDFRKRQYPPFPLPAVAGFIMDSNSRILLIKRASPPSKNKWSLPGGMVDLGEKLEAALHREILEECGIGVQIGPLFNAASRIVKDQNNHIQYHYIILNYLCQYIGGPVQANSDAGEAQWFHLKEIEKLDLSEGIFDVIQKGIQILAE